VPGREELHQRGVRAATRGRHADARRLLDRAREGLLPGDLRARIDCSLAYVWSETGDAAGALYLCDEALMYPGLSDETRGTLHSQIGLLKMLHGETESALGAFEAATRLLGDHHRLARLHLNKGNVFLQRSRSSDAADCFRRAAEHYELAGDSYGVAKARHNLGYALFLEGDLVGALDHMGRAYPVFAAEGPVMTAMVEQDRAEVLLAAGQWREGTDLLRAAAKAFGARRLTLRQAEAELALATQLGPHQPSRARDAARSAERRFARVGADTWRARAQLQRLASEVALGDASPGLVATAEQLCEELTGHRLRWPAVTADLLAARVELRRGDLPAAVARLRGRRVGRAAPLGVRLLHRDVRAEAAAAAGRRGAALGHVRAGLDDLSDWQSSFGSLDLQTNVVGQGIQLAVRGLELAVASRSSRVLFEWSERARMLASRVQPVRAPADPQLAADLAELRASPSAGREAELRRRIREQAWQREGSGRVTDPVALDELRARLGDRALVAYVVAGGRCVALAVTGDRAVRVDLGEVATLGRELGGLLPDLDVAAGELGGELSRMVRGELAARLGRLAEGLVTPVLPVIGERQVVLTPAGLLAGVPWTLLPGFAGRPVTLAQSATSWLARNDRPLRTATAGLVAGPRVARADGEVQAAAKEWDAAHVLTGTAATTAATAELAASVDVLHVAAHGRHSSQSPLFSGVGLVDGTWFGYDVDQLAAVPDVVLLSACEVGRSTVRWGEELIGMTAAWLHAGARCVIASSAAVADEAAYETLVGVHRSLAGGAHPAEALADAVPAASADRAPAPFVCFS